MVFAHLIVELVYVEHCVERQYAGVDRCGVNADASFFCLYGRYDFYGIGLYLKRQLFLVELSYLFAVLVNLFCIEHVCVRNICGGASYKEVVSCSILNFRYGNVIRRLS